MEFKVGDKVKLFDREGCWECKFFEEGYWWIEPVNKKANGLYRREESMTKISPKKESKKWKIFYLFGGRF